jgi:hypothetical protein
VHEIHKLGKLCCGSVPNKVKVAGSRTVLLLSVYDSVVILFSRASRNDEMTMVEISRAQSRECTDQLAYRR